MKEHSLKVEALAKALIFERGNGNRLLSSRQLADLGTAILCLENDIEIHRNEIELAKIEKFQDTDQNSIIEDVIDLLLEKQHILLYFEKPSPYAEDINSGIEVCSFYKIYSPKSDKNLLAEFRTIRNLDIARFKKEQEEEEKMIRSMGKWKR